LRVCDSRVAGDRNTNREIHVNKLLRAVAIAAAMLSFIPAVQAAQDDGLTEIRAQLRGLMQRVEKLEQDNVVLKAENASLKVQAEVWRTQSEGGMIKVAAAPAATSAADAPKPRAPDWTDRVTVKGDVRYRYEFTSDETTNAAGVQAADRYRDRIRARLNVDAKVNDEVTLGIGIASGENGDPRSSNQTLTGVFNRKAFDLDLAYVDWKFASFGNLILGKMKQPFFKPSQSAYFDSDVNPEGVAVTFNRGNWFGSAYGYTISEISGAENTVTADTMLYGGQIGARLPIGSSNLTLAVMYYDLAAGKGRAPFFNPAPGGANGNTLVGTPAVLANDFRVVDLAAEYAFKLGNMPMLLWADATQNQGADDNDEAFSGGVTFGKASNPGSWEFGVGYYSVEADAVFGQIFESDFANGLTDSEGMIIRGGYALQRNWTINATYFLNDRNMDLPNAVGQTDVDFDRVQLDLNFKF
jgi:hypothetical protein